MTFIDNKSEPPTTVQIILFCILTVAFMVITYKLIFQTQTRRHYHRVITVRFLLPFGLICCVLENIALACSGVIIENESDDHILLRIIFVLQATQVPVFLLALFELTYLVHKKRSVHFCGMFFDEGRLGRYKAGVFSTPVKSFVFRNLIRFLAFLCCLLGFFANFDLLRDKDEKDTLAGRTGWWQLLRSKDAIYSAHVLMSLIPTLVLVFCSFFLSIALWRYGINSSMVVHSALPNPWSFPLFGTLFLLIGQTFDERWYPFTSNLGYFIYSLSILRLMKEIDKDIDINLEFTDFLKQVARKGNAISVKNDDSEVLVIGDKNQKLDSDELEDDEEIV